MKIMNEQNQPLHYYNAVDQENKSKCGWKENQPVLLELSQQEFHTTLQGLMQETSVK